MTMRSAIRLAYLSLALAALLGAAPLNAADTPNPTADAKAFQDFFTKKLPKLKLEEFVNGPYSMDEGLFKQWQDKEQFPPYEFAVDLGKEMFSKPFKNGKSYADCFPNQGIGVRAAQKRVGFSLDPDGRARANPVVVAGPHGRRIGNRLQHALKAAPLGARVGLRLRPANLSDKQQVARDQNLVRRLV